MPARGYRFSGLQVHEASATAAGQQPASAAPSAAAVVLRYV
jgi:hypothetical protein